MGAGNKNKGPGHNLILALLVFTATALLSWYTKAPDGPHGGVVKKAGNYYIEMKNPENYFSVYLLDRKLKTIKDKVDLAEVRFFMSDSTTLDVKLTPSPGNAYATKSIPGFVSCKITFKVSGNEISAMFENHAQVAELKNK
jgi:hypothetical protein